MTKFNHVAQTFPTLKKELGSYDPGSFIIRIEDTTSLDFREIRSAPLDAKNIEKIKTFFHEVRHSVDHISTLWGQRYLVKYIKALNARATGNINNFSSIIDYKNEESQLNFDLYFTEHYNYIPIPGLDERWKAKPTIGYRFTSSGNSDSSRPIPFLNFFSFDDRPLMRIPISVASLLETNAKAEEIYWQIQHIATFSESERPFHLRFFANETLANLIYNQDLALYNVAVHACANILNIKDILEAFKISSTIATLALNIPKALASSIKPIEYNDTDIDTRRIQMINNHEYGYIFICLLENYRERYNDVKEYTERQFNIEDVLKCSGLPSSKELKQIILSEMNGLFDEVKKYSFFQHIFIDKLTMGKKIFNILDVKSNLTITKAFNESKYKPYVYLDDNTELEFRSISNTELQEMAPFNSLSQSDWFDVASLFAIRMNEFYQIRGV